MDTDDGGLRVSDDMDAQTVLYHLGRGADHAVLLGDLAETLNWKRRRVEIACRALRLDGWPLASSGKGMYLADLPELDRTIASLQRRLAAQYLTLRKLRKSRDQLLPSVQATLPWTEAA